jgi:hypothetical protein
LTDVEGNEITELPPNAQRDLDEVCELLNAQEIRSMELGINGWADAVGDEDKDFFASNWTTGKDWSEVADGVFQPLYGACESRPQSLLNYSQFQRAGWMFGWLVRAVMIGRSDDWVMYKNPEAGTDEVPRQFWGTFYWRRNRQKPQ